MKEFGFVNRSRLGDYVVRQWSHVEEHRPRKEAFLREAAEQLGVVHSAYNLARVLKDLGLKWPYPRGVQRVRRSMMNESSFQLADLCPTQ